jgi:hypothetical protein
VVAAWREAWAEALTEAASSSVVAALGFVHRGLQLAEAAAILGGDVLRQIALGDALQHGDELGGGPVDHRIDLVDAGDELLHLLVGIVDLQPGREVAVGRGGNDLADIGDDARHRIGPGRAGCGLGPLLGLQRADLHQLVAEEQQRAGDGTDLVTAPRLRDRRLELAIGEPVDAGLDRGERPDDARDDQGAGGEHQRDQRAEQQVEHPLDLVDRGAGRVELGFGAGLDQPEELVDRLHDLGLHPVVIGRKQELAGEVEIALLLDGVFAAAVLEQALGGVHGACLEGDETLRLGAGLIELGEFRFGEAGVLHRGQQRLGLAGCAWAHRIVEDEVPVDPVRLGRAGLLAGAHGDDFEILLLIALIAGDGEGPRQPRQIVRALPEFVRQQIGGVRLAIGIGAGIDRALLEIPRADDGCDQGSEESGNT